MSPTADPGGMDIWAQIIEAIARMGLRSVLSIERALPLVLPAGIAAFLYGTKFGYRGAALKLFVATGMFMAVVVTPVIMREFGLDEGTWGTTVCCLVSIYCYKGVRWAESLIRLRLGLDRRTDREAVGGDR